LHLPKKAEEKKREGSLVDYITPIIQFGVGSAVAFFTNLKKIPAVANGVKDFFKADKNREDFWAALKRLPILIIIGALLEGTLAIFFRRRLDSRKANWDVSDFVVKQNTYAYMTLFYQFLYSLLFLRNFCAESIYWKLDYWFLARIICFKNFTFGKKNVSS